MSRAAAALAVTLLTAAACSAGGGSSGGPRATAPGEPTPGADRFAVTGDDPSIVVHALTYGADMIVGGTLRYQAEGRCLTVSSPRDGRETVFTPVWPAGTRPVNDGARRGVDVPGFGRIMEGDRVDAGGDEWPMEDERLRDARSCPPSDRAMVLNPGSFHR
ncbi:hypothetical protein [Nonomuraea rhodomycinica]|uniref:Lipoprotein n=1 Tax=Nonomuraea rhodomycinica TaxID=1712872 RepID=A0A7Y6IX12_9ACTN|nr:hypothetical protein [Nonomuraea rhodomycinica]NUW44619.1 hypothetical protein [Nonomuraea rhodomycinica]